MGHSVMTHLECEDSEDLVSSAGKMSCCLIPGKHQTMGIGCVSLDFTSPSAGCGQSWPPGFPDAQVLTVFDVDKDFGRVSVSPLLDLMSPPEFLGSAS